MSSCVVGMMSLRGNRIMSIIWQITKKGSYTPFLNLFKMECEFLSSFCTCKSGFPCVKSKILHVFTLGLLPLESPSISRWSALAFLWWSANFNLFFSRPNGESIPFPVFSVNPTLFEFLCCVAVTRYLGCAPITSRTAELFTENVKLPLWNLILPFRHVSSFPCQASLVKPCPMFMV